MNVDSLAGQFFLDTNIFVYTFDISAPEKKAIARKLVDHALQTQQGCISTQVLQEFLNVALRKFDPPLTLEESQDYLQTVLSPLCKQYPSLSFYQKALRLQLETGFSFYDTLILAAAIEIECSVLLTEDMQDGRVIEGVKIVNPFANVEHDNGSLLEKQ